VDQGTHYYLFSRGPDGLEGTADDIFPVIGVQGNDKIGYRRKPK